MTARSTRLSSSAAQRRLCPYRVFTTDLADTYRRAASLAGDPRFDGQHGDGPWFVQAPAIVARSRSVWPEIIDTVIEDLRELRTKSPSILHGIRTIYHRRCG